MTRDPAIKVAVIGGICTIVTAIIAGAFALAGNRAIPTPTAGTVTTTSGPVSSATSSSPASSSSPPTVSSTTSPASGSLPAEFVGTWKGLMVQHDPAGDFVYATAFTLNEAADISGAVGESTDYVEGDFGSISCSYLLGLGDVADNSVDLEMYLADSNPVCVGTQYMALSVVSGTLSVQIRNVPGGEVVAESQSTLSMA